jgi:malate dehydrogenase (oxaloacetate-decarboxylating)
MVRDGLTGEETTGRVWPVDRQGLLTDDMDGLRDFQAPYARPASEVEGWAREDGAIGLREVVGRVRPTLLLGTSTVHGAFTEEIVTTMARGTERPAVLPMSNPTDRMEAAPEDLLRWTRGRALVAVGVPADPVTVDGVEYSIAQANNALVFPGIGLGAIVCRARAVTDPLIRAAAEAVAAMVDTSAPGAPLLPRVRDLREVSARVAAAVVEKAREEGLARVPVTDPDRQVRDAMWQPVYRPLRAL